MANFGTNILHAKTIIPLIEKNIPLRILNTFDSENKGTLIGLETEYFETHKEYFKDLETQLDYMIFKNQDYVLN